MKPTRTPLKAALAFAALSAAGLLAVPAHAGLLGNGSFGALAIADGANCPSVPLGKSCLEGVAAKHQADGSEVVSLLLKSAGNSEAISEMTVAFVRDSFGHSDANQGRMDALGLSCAADPAACRDKLFGTSGRGEGSEPGVAASGSAGSAFSLGFMQAVGGVQVSSQYGLSFLQAGMQTAAKGGDTAASSPERWEVTYGASSQPAAAVAPLEGSASWSATGLQFQGTSATQMKTYMASGPSGLIGTGVMPQLGSPSVTPLTGCGNLSGICPPTSVPEPSALMLVGAALASLALLRRRQSFLR